MRDTGFVITQQQLSRFAANYERQADGSLKLIDDPERSRECSSLLGGGGLASRGSASTSTSAGGARLSRPSVSRGQGQRASSWAPRRRIAADSAAHSRADASRCSALAFRFAAMTRGSAWGSRVSVDRRCCRTRDATCCSLSCSILEARSKSRKASCSFCSVSAVGRTDDSSRRKLYRDRNASITSLALSASAASSRPARIGRRVSTRVFRAPGKASSARIRRALASVDEAPGTTGDSGWLDRSLDPDGGGSSPCPPGPPKERRHWAACSLGLVPGGGTLCRHRARSTLSGGGTTRWPGSRIAPGTG